MPESARVKARERSKLYYQTHREEQSKRNYLKMLEKGKIIKSREETLNKHGLKKQEEWVPPTTLEVSSYVGR